MIKFFRKIRQKLLSESKFSKYLLYAVGEIVLVVIGILIALQINNQNIYKHERSIERTYLKALKAEYEINLTKLNETIDLNYRIIASSNKLIEVFQQNVLDTISEKTVMKYFFNTFSDEVNYKPSKGVHTEIISSGNLKLIQNEILKRKFSTFESSLDEIRHQENEINISRLEIMEHFRNQGNLKRYLSSMGWEFNWESIFEKRNNKELFTSLRFFNGLFFFQNTSVGANYFCYEPIKRDMEETIKLIESELNK
ncbi:hypothetical protein E1J38_013840 [Seonamhaeicola sediminis]|uniref:Uncharacterized protein n=1 Tax=Seonamhaeicola sediminis TaxID=2528206 RepID=A0A562YAI0_9FLAO|nr:DUF6090 family protein [Seonamhaeicola sediminis]TWO31348.1 hypothetical protein E1J38_013840 [Seonamhaeicola sediminis]